MTRILIVEDEERIVSFLEKGLRANGYTTVAVSDGDSAVARWPATTCSTSSSSTSVCRVGTAATCSVPSGREANACRSWC